LLLNEGHRICLSAGDLKLGEDVKDIHRRGVRERKLGTNRANINTDRVSQRLRKKRGEGKSSPLTFGLEQ
jgi:hypothetical protein